jgi:hypothetical protein
MAQATVTTTAFSVKKGRLELCRPGVCSREHTIDLEKSLGRGGWINLIVREAGASKTFGYSTTDKRWSYNDRPPVEILEAQKGLKATAPAPQSMGSRESQTYVAGGKLWENE